MAKQEPYQRSKSSSPPRVRRTKKALLTQSESENESASVSSHSSARIDVDPLNPIDPPPWLYHFRPRLPPQDSSQWWQSPIPRCENIGHAILLRDAMTKFHLAVYLADDDAGENRERLRQNLSSICQQYMPAMVKLGIKKHQIVFFYHGRGLIWIGNEVWEAITGWESDRYRITQSEERRIWQECQDRERHNETTARMRRSNCFAWGPSRKAWDTNMPAEVEIKW